MSRGEGGMEMGQRFVVGIEGQSIFASTEKVMGGFWQIACHLIMIGDLACPRLASSIAAHMCHQYLGDTAMEQAAACHTGRFVDKGAQLLMAKVIEKRKLFRIILLGIGFCI